MDRISGKEYNWIIATAEEPAGSVLYSIRENTPTPDEKELFGILVIARWSYESINNSGYPDEATWNLISKFDDRITEVSMEPDPWFAMAAIITHNGEREWRLYCYDVGVFEREFNKVLTGPDIFPLEFEVFDDPDWLGHSELLDNVADQ